MLLRRAEPGDELAVAAVHVAGWQAGYAGLLPASYLDGLQREDHAARYSFADGGVGRPATVVAVEADDVIGFATTGPVPNAESVGQGQLYALYVRPDCWRRGVGRRLLVDARARLVHAGCTTAVLWMLAGNERAQRFYRADGWRPNGARRNETLDGIELDVLGYARRLT